MVLTLNSTYRRETGFSTPAAFPEETTSRWTLEKEGHVMDEWPTKTVSEMSFLQMMSKSPGNTSINENSHRLRFLKGGEIQLRLTDQPRTHLLFIVCYFHVLLLMCDSGVTVRMFSALSLKS